MTIVADTNILLSGFLFKKGNSAKVVDQFRDGTLDLVFCELTRDEFLKKYPEVTKRINRGQELFPEVRRQIHKFGKIIEFTPEATVCRDPKDNIFLDTAYFGEVEYLVTGDKDLLTVKSYRKIAIVTPKEFAEKVLTGKQ